MKIKQKKYILITGGAGYIGSHITIKFLKSGFDVIIIDNLSNSDALSILRVEKITNKKPIFFNGDIRNSELLDKIFSNFKIDTIIHLAGLKAVGESFSKPLDYFENNVGGTIRLCQSMLKFGINKILFSSSATVYGAPLHIPITEQHQVGNTTNPYGTSKFIIERILYDISYSNPDLSIGLLRYFNPVGAHKSGLIGENPNGIPNNLMPYITQVAVGKISELSVYGFDYNTPDGTGIRDYIHVMDLAEGHYAALEFLSNKKGLDVWNLGTGKGYSVIEVIKTFEKISGKKVPYRLCSRRTGDIDISYASPQKAISELKWKANRSLITMIEDAWRWQQMNPNGFDSG